MKERISRIEDKLDKRSILNKKSKKKKSHSVSRKEGEESGIDNSMYEST